MNGRAKMTARDVGLARDLASIGYSLARIARWLGGGYDSVRHAVSGRSWSHLPRKKGALRR